MDFVLSEEQQRLVERARIFGSQHFTTKNVRRWCDDHGVPDELMKEYLDSGLAQLGLAENLGGVQTDLVSLVLVLEELTFWAGASLPFQYQALNMSMVGNLGSEEQVKHLRELFLETGMADFSFAFAEPNSSSDMFIQRTHVSRQDDGLFLDGSKTYVINGEFMPYVLVVASGPEVYEPDAPARVDASTIPPVSFWMVPRDSEGLYIAPLKFVGHQMMSFSTMEFDHVRVQPEWRVGEPECTTRHLLISYEIQRLINGASCVGLTRAAVHDVALYLRNRRSTSTDAHFDQVSSMVVDMEASLRAMRDMLYHTAWSFDVKSSSHWLSTALLDRFVTNTAMEITSNALKAIGSGGYVDVARVSRIWRDCCAYRFAAGTDEVLVTNAFQRIADNILEEERQSAE